MEENYNNRESFSFYKSFDDLMDYVNSNYGQVPNDYGGKNSSSLTKPIKDFVGSDDLELLNSKLTDFIDPHRLNLAVKEIEELFSTINLGGAFDKDKMVATDLPIGVFDFSLASQGLFRPQEYYSPDLDRVINPDFVKTIKSDTNTYVYVENQITYFLIQQQEGTFSLKQKQDYINQLLDSGSSQSKAEELAKERFPKAKLVFRTKTKKVNLIRQSKTIKDNSQGKEQYVDVFIKVGGNALQTPRSLLYQNMPSLLLSYFLDKSGIKTRILGLLTNAKDTKKGFRKSLRFTTSFLIKDYEESLNFNEIAILTADSRTFRYKLNKAKVVEYYKKLKSDVGIFLGMTVIGDDFDETFERYKKYYVTEGVLGNAKIRNKNTRLMISSARTVDPDDSDEKLLKGVIEEFFRLVDAIDIEFNGSKVALPRIKVREQKRGIDISNLRQRLKATVRQSTKYDDSTSPYSNTEKEISEREALRNKLLNDIDQTFKNY